MKNQPNYYQRQIVGATNQEMFDQWIHQPWPIKKGFEMKLIIYLQERLFIMLPKNFTHCFPCPKELIDCVGYIGLPLLLQPVDKNEMDLRTNPNLFRKKPNPIVYLFNFIVNNMTSFVYET